jgi:hypothetical protein
MKKKYNSSNVEMLLMNLHHNSYVDYYQKLNEQGQ